MNLSYRLSKIVYKLLPRKISLMLYSCYFKLSKWSGLKTSSLILTIDITDHCNLNCKNCNAFSPVANTYNIPIESVKKDVETLRKLGGVTAVHFGGGEPLLHPQILDILNLAHETLPKTRFCIVTNGTLLSKQGPEFWKTLKNTNTYIQISHYPIDIHYNKIKSNADAYGVTVIYYPGKYPWYKFPLDLAGKNDPNAQFMKCQSALACVRMNEGKIYPCYLVPRARVFNNYFGNKLHVCEKDYLEMSKINSLQDICDFVSKPIPFCRYCTAKKIETDWAVSKKELDEFLL